MKRLIRYVFEERYEISDIDSHYFSERIRKFLMDYYGRWEYLDYVPNENGTYIIPYTRKELIWRMPNFKYKEVICALNENIDALIGDTILIDDIEYKVINKIFKQNGDVDYETEILVIKDADYYNKKSQELKKINEANTENLENVILESLTKQIEEAKKCKK